MATGQATIEELITVLVGETNESEDEEAKSADQLRLLMRKHYTVGGLTDVLSVFGPVKDDVKQKNIELMMIYIYFYSLQLWVKLLKVEQWLSSGI
jgi:hypothetical protein